MTIRSVIKLQKRMSPRTKEQFNTIRKEKENLILQTSLRLFASKSFETTSVSTIAKEAGISKGLLYNYFENKDDLLIRILHEGMGDFIKTLKIGDPNKIKKTELVFFISQNFHLLAKNPDYYKLYFSLILQPKVLSILETEMMTIFGSIINAFINYFEQKGEKNAYVKARYMLAVFDGIGIHYLSDIDNFPLEKVEEMIIDQL